MDIEDEFGRRRAERGAIDIERTVELSAFFAELGSN